MLDCEQLNGTAMFYESAANDHRLERDPLKACVVPRPIGWVTTISQAGIVNLAPYSFFNLVVEKPPIVMFCVNKPHAVDGGLKDSVRNVLETAEFVVNLATWDLRAAVNATAAAVPPGSNEMDLAGLQPSPSILVRPPRVRASPINLECRLHRLIELPSLRAEEPNHMVLGSVVGVHIADDIIRNGRVDITLARPIARLGYSDYSVVSETFSIERPRWPGTAPAAQ